MKGSDTKRTRRDRGEMEEIMFKLFERQSNWTLKQLLHETDQPEVCDRNVFFFRVHASKFLFLITTDATIFLSMCILTTAGNCGFTSESFLKSFRPTPLLYRCPKMIQILTICSFWKSKILEGDNIRT